MKTQIYTIIISTFFLTVSSNAQINVGGLISAGTKAVKGFTFSDADAAAMSKPAVRKMDSLNKVAGPKDPYTVRLNKVFGKHASEKGLKLNYKVYLMKEVNAFATADGSVRVYSGLMDLMDDNELLAVIGHEIGHVANSDSKDAMKQVYMKEALIEGAGSQSDKIAAVANSQYGKIGSAFIDSKHSRKQESEADDFSYDFMKRNGYNVNAVASAFELLAKLSGEKEAGFLDKMLASHPDPKDRAEKAKERAIADGLYKEYVRFEKPKTASTKKPTKKKK